MLFYDNYLAAWRRCARFLSSTFFDFLLTLDEHFEPVPPPTLLFPFLSFLVADTGLKRGWVSPHTVDHVYVY